MSEPIIKENEEYQKVKAEDKHLRICPECSKYYGRWTLAVECDCGCGDYFADGEEIICSEGRHYSKFCFEQMKTDGLVKGTEKGA